MQCSCNAEVQVLINVYKVPEEPERAGAEGIESIITLILQRGMNM